MTKALLIVDVQNDFTEGGVLGVRGGKSVARRITGYLAEHADEYAVVIASRDWHDGDNDNGGHFSESPDYADTWPPHCIAGTEGAAYDDALDTANIDVHVEKGQGMPAYSAFEGRTGDDSALADVLRGRAIDAIDVVGIATDHCVRASALDGIEAGFDVTVFEDLVAGVDGDRSVAALDEIRAQGGHVVPSPGAEASRRPNRGPRADIRDGRLTVDGVPTQLFIGGVWRDASGGRTFPVRNPATGAVLATVADATVGDGLAALDAAASVQRQWAATAPRERSDILRRTFELVRGHEDDIAALMTLEMGKPLAEARGEVVYGAEFLRWFSEEAVRVRGDYFTNPEGTGRAVVLKRPVGPCFAITPWNFPLAMATRKIAPALAAGCTIVVKPADLTPLTTLYLARLFEEAGLPAGVLSVVTTVDAPAVSAAIIDDQRLRKLTFTGSTGVGSKLLEQASKNVLRTSMELGGNAPFLVFDDADVPSAVRGAMTAKFRNNGEACTAANRFFVQEGIADEFVAALTAAVRELRVGDGGDAETTIGPLIDDRAVAKVHGLVGDAIDRGAQVAVGGRPIDGPGSFYAPTVLDAVRPGSEILTTEIFGPVVSVTRFQTEDEAVRLANDTEFGLVSYVFGEDLRRAQRLAERLETGMLAVNTGLISNAAAPFGGVKASGLGREGSREGIEEYLETVYMLTPDPFVS